MAGKSNLSSSVSEAPGGDRLRAFMRRFGFQNSHDVAQAFRVSQTTAARWMKDATTRSVDEAMPGPALILLELMESGVETPDLRKAQSLASLRENPQDFGLYDDEDQWKIEISRSARHGAKIVTPSGHYIVAHSGWFRERIKRLSADSSKAALRLIQRYTDAINNLAELPR